MHRELIDRPDWMQKAACRGLDPELFYPQRGITTKEAKAVCDSCEVCALCLEYALVNGEKFGIWGGLAERQRRKLRQRRARGSAA